jgi:hypothetical protein
VLTTGRDGIVEPSSETDNEWMVESAEKENKKRKGKTGKQLFPV